MIELLSSKDAILPNPQDFATALMNAITQGFTNFVDMSYQQLVAFTTQKVEFQTGAGVSYLQPLVLRFWQANVTIADAALAVFITWIALNVILSQYEPLQMMSRVVLAAVAAHASLQFTALFVELNNALCRAALAVAQTPNLQDIAALLGVPLTGGRGVGAFLFQDLFIKIMADAVLFQMIVRVGVLDLLIPLLPLLALLLITPVTQQAAFFGFSAFFAVLFLQFLQVSAIAIGAALVTGLTATLSIASTFAGIAVLYLVLRIPGWVAGAIGNYISTIRSPIS
jgi:hypothetical protein